MNVDLSFIEKQLSLNNPSCQTSTTRCKSRKSCNYYSQLCKCCAEVK